MTITHPDRGDGALDFEAEGARREERLAQVEPIIKELFEELGKRQSIGAVLQTIASVAFGLGVGRDELIRVIKTDIFASEGALEKALRISIDNEITITYRGSRQGHLVMSADQKATAETFLAHFVLAMRRESTVSSFFHRLLAGNTKAGVIVNHNPHASVTRRSFSDWAHGFNVKRLIKNRFAELVDPVVYDEYDQHIRHRPEEYIKPLLPMVVIVGPTSEAIFHSENLEKLIRDVCCAIPFREFIRIVKEGLPESTNISGSEIKKAREQWGIIADEELDKRIRFKEIEYRDDAVATVRKRVRRDLEDELFEPKVLFEIATSTENLEKLIIEMKNKDGQLIGHFRLHQSVLYGQDFRGHIADLLCKKDSHVVELLRQAGIRPFARDSREIDDLAARLLAYRRNGTRNGNRRRRKKR